MTFDDIANMIRRHEGTRYEVYRDHLGNVTGGVGHYFEVGSKLPIPVVEKLFWHDLYSVYQDYEDLGLELSSVRMAVVIDMIFNLGISRFKMFKKMIAAIRANDCETAVKEMLDSKWASQLPLRSNELAMMFYDDKEV